MAEPINYNDGNWHQWNGGECPIHEETIISSVFADVYEPESKAGWMDWSHGTGQNTGDIISFRVVTEYKEVQAPKEYWVYEGQDGTGLVLTEEPTQDRSMYTHVREII